MISEGLKRNSTLIQLYLNSNENKENNKKSFLIMGAKKDNKIGDEGVKIISEGLKSNSTLLMLFLNGDGKREMKR